MSIPITHQARVEKATPSQNFQTGKLATKAKSGLKGKRKLFGGKLNRGTSEKAARMLKLISVSAKGKKQWVALLNFVRVQARNEKVTQTQRWVRLQTQRTTFLNLITNKSSTTSMMAVSNEQV
ncbi:hypothetical protein LWI29_004218 [Acer saccharum]|uniref:Uncharacterized protein n=1 Tax=Acer saccharum TaxID=4024 RepID=A0AA39SSR6_ACESA|nr:hypothetical protein LWI29_004218 [Acer saccharum]